MDDPVLASFAEACGAARSLDLRVDLVGGGTLAEGSVHMPYTLVGRHDACDVTLTDAEVNPRHAWLQVLGGRVYAVDLGSRTGLNWPDGTNRSGWLDVGTPVRIGPFRLHLRNAVAPYPRHFPPNYQPLQSDPEVLRNGPAILLEFRNGKRASDRWMVNRLITLVGRSPECKIQLTADDIAGYHCGLVHTATGLWVVDLSGRGVVVNGERMRVAPLQDGAELWIGRFLIGIHDRATHDGLKPVAKAITPPPVMDHASPSPSGPAEDEVELGTIPKPDSAMGLPSSHIMADVFRFWSRSAEVNEPISNPILVSGGNSAPQLLPPDPINATSPGDLPMEPVAEAVIGPLLQQLRDIYGQMFAQFQESLVLLVRLFSCLRPDQASALHREFERIQELNAELAHLQAEVSHRAVEVLRPPRRDTADLSVMAQTPASNSVALHQRFAERINILQHERHRRWQSLVGLVSSKIA